MRFMIFRLPGKVGIIRGDGMPVVAIGHAQFRRYVVGFGLLDDLGFLLGLHRGRALCGLNGKIAR